MSDADSGLSIRRVSTADQVASLVRERILRGDFRPGSALREVTLAAAIGVSRNTLREALRILIQEGLVQHSVHRGITVTRMSTDSAADIYRIRRLLEVAAVESSRPAPEQLAALAAAADHLDRAAAAHDWPSLVEADMRFHRTLVSLLGSERLDAFFGNLLSELRLGLVAVDRASGDLSGMSGQHREFHRLLEAGQRKECARRLRAHLDEAEQLFRAVITADPPGADD